VLDSSILFLQNGQLMVAPYGDQGAFCATVEKLGFNPFVLPLNWNFRPQFHTAFFGPLKVWHDYSEPPQPFWDLNARYENTESIIDYHTVNWQR